MRAFTRDPDSDQSKSLRLSFWRVCKSRILPLSGNDELDCSENRTAAGFQDARIGYTRPSRNS